MIDLDDLDQLNKMDSGKVALSIEKFPEQIKQAWEEASQLDLPTDYSLAKNIVVAGMGGSTIGVDLLRNLFKDSLMVPLIVNNHYKLPNFVNSDSLVLLLSYSGTTEEVLAAGEDAKDRKAKVVGITIGGQLSQFLKENNFPAYEFNPLANPSNQPRLGLGYTFIGAMAILAKLNFLKVDSSEISTTLGYLDQNRSKLIPTSSKQENIAKRVAGQLFNKEIFIVGSEHLAGNAHVFANQINENSKNLANYYIIPELNHHLLEGLTKPEKLRSELAFVFLDSDLFSEKISKRIAVTKEVLEKQNISSISIKLNAESKFSQAIEAVSVLAWISFYLGILNGVDAAKIPWVDYFKKRLAEAN